MVKFLIFSDTHESGPKSGEGISGHAQRIARQVDADAIVCQGDLLQGLWSEEKGQEGKLFDRMGQDQRTLTTSQFEKEYTTVLDNLTDGNLPVYAIAGNHDGISNYTIERAEDKVNLHLNYHDPLGLDLLESHPKIRSIEKGKDGFKGIELGGVGGHREIRPGGATPVEYHEDEFRRHLEVLGELDYLVTHTSPHNSGLDTVPYNPRFESDAETPVFDDAGNKVGLSVGSKAIREYIDAKSPRYNTHGHIHESVGIRYVGDTLCMNAAFEPIHNENGNLVKPPVLGMLDTEDPKKTGLLRLG